ncbi:MULTISPECIES: calcium-binding protein [unclassified Rhizobium]|uniref:calcium-binding protein n=1 Tax=unclassified Rhizobium TaxID=2613769 RepID=UPI000713E636|nr:MULTISPECIES: calcium-binding protein [unclassified Rhizobium]KQT01796.1 hypothetical protein ASG50_19095 [Rhizobium sp. Leaf386]KQT03246.1 hypothetical protein ASG42_24890 [Rhizobium sp. Leaf391]
MALMYGDDMPRNGIKFPATWTVTGPLPTGTVYASQLTQGDITLTGSFSYTVDQVTGEVKNLQGTVTGVSARFPHYISSDEGTEIEGYTRYQIVDISRPISTFTGNLSSADIAELLFSGNDTIVYVKNFWDDAIGFRLLGYGGNDTLVGSDDSEILDGGTGQDTMVGGDGADRYIVDNIADIVVEKLSSNGDTIESSVSYVLPAYVSYLELVGSADLNGTGNSEDNRLTGNIGNNILDGREGADKMTGGAGNDTYYVDNVSDQVIEGSNGGVDHVISSINITIATNIENVTLVGAASRAYGNALANHLIGNDKNNYFNGGAGADIMAAGKGDDFYFVDNIGDKVIETASNGLDRIESRVSFSLAGIHVEQLTLSGPANINGTGNSLDNVLTGSSARNVLDGGAGNDKLQGGKGPDKLFGGSGADHFIFSAVTDSTVSTTFQDTIMDFSRTQGDRIDLSPMDANALLLLNQSFKFIGTAAYSEKAGQLRYGVSGNETVISGDVDGDGASDFRITLDRAIALVASDFIL